MSLRTLNDLENLKEKRVLIRVDFNVPLNEKGDIRDDKRIKHALPTLQYLLEKGVKQIILATHVGRPKNDEPHLKTDVLARHLEGLINESVEKIDDWGGRGMPESKMVMLENLRFNPSEKSKDEGKRDAFGKQLANLADFYVNEAFSNSHRSHASMTSVPKFIPGVAGLGVEKEVKAIQIATQQPKKPLVAVIGGLKADKLTAIYNLLEIADKILVAGALACNLLKSKGYEIGDSKSDDEGMEEKSELVKAILGSDKVELPTDFIVADAFSETSNHKVVSASSIEEGWMALDIGPESSQTFAEELEKAQTILWFGPIGVFELPPFANGTTQIGEAIAKNPGTTIIGGGDSASAVKKLGLSEKMTLVSTGGGASLQMIEGNPLPALELLSE